MALIPEIEIGGPSGPSHLSLGSDPEPEQPSPSAIEHSVASQSVDRIPEVSFKTGANGQPM
jgi:hypothetical protein